MLALGGGYMVRGRGQSASDAAVPVIKPLHPVKHHVVVKAAPKKAAAHKTVAAKPVAKKGVPKKGAAKPVVAKTAVKPKVHVPAVIDGMPSALALALRAHKVVVVSL